MSAGLGAVVEWDLLGRGWCWLEEETRDDPVFLEDHVASFWTAEWVCLSLGINSLNFGVLA